MRCRTNLFAGFLVRDIPKLARDYLYRAIKPILKRHHMFAMEYPPLESEKWCVS